MESYFDFIDREADELERQERIDLRERCRGFDPDVDPDENIPTESGWYLRWYCAGPADVVRVDVEQGMAAIMPREIGDDAMVVSLDSLAFQVRTWKKIQDPVKEMAEMMKAINEIL